MKKMPFGICSGCNDETYLPPAFDGQCFLCATDGPPGTREPTFGALSEDEVRRPPKWDDGSVLSFLQEEIRGEFEELQFYRSTSRTEILGSNYADRFCFSTFPNAVTKALWLNRHLRPDPAREEIRQAKREAAAEAKRQRRIRDENIEKRRQHIVEQIALSPNERRGRPRRLDSALCRAEAYILAYPGSNIEEVAKGLQVEHRQAGRLLYANQEHGRVLRIGAYGQSRFYPGPRANLVKPSAPEKQGILSCVMSVKAIEKLEEYAQIAGVEIGIFIEQLIREKVSADSLIETQSNTDAAIPVGE